MKIISWLMAFVITATLSLSSFANPKKIGYIVNYGTHEWYQNVIFGLQSRADELGIDFEVMDANLDINKQTAQAEDFMTKGVDLITQHLFIFLITMVVSLKSLLKKPPEVRHPQSVTLWHQDSLSALSNSCLSWPRPATHGLSPISF